MTVNEVQVTDRLLIGEVDPANPDTSNFLTKDDLQKLQDQIIVPSQTIYVNSIFGNDNNDGSSSSKAVKTLNKAYELINKNVPSITFILNNSQEGQVYEATPLDMISGEYSTENITYKQEMTQSGGVIHPTIKLKYGEVNGSANFHNSVWQNKIRCGNILYNGSANLTLQYLNFEVDSVKPVNIDYRNYLCRTNNLSVYSCYFNLPKYTLAIPYSTSMNINISSSNFYNNEMFIARYFDDIPEQWEDEKNLETAVSTSNESCYLLATILYTTIPEAIKSLQGNGVANSIGVIKKNWS